MAAAKKPRLHHFGIRGFRLAFGRSLVLLQELTLVHNEESTVCILLSTASLGA